MTRVFQNITMAIIVNIIKVLPLHLVHHQVHLQVIIQAHLQVLLQTLHQEIQQRRKIIQRTIVIKPKRALLKLKRRLPVKVLQ